MSDRIASVWGPRTPTARDGRWPVRVDVRLDLGLTEADVEHWVPSACVLCSNGCGADIAVRDGRMVGVRGRATDVVNHGRLGPKGLHASCRAANSDRRLTRPLVRRGGELVETGWDTAMERIVERSRYLLERHGPSSHGFYGSGQMMAEEYYTWGVIAKAGIGTNHMDGNTRLCTATAAAAMKESFGSDGQPGSYTDVESCDVIALYGHNMAETQTVLWARVLDRLEGPNPPTVIAVDPRSTPVADAARRTGGVHLAPLPGTNLALLNGMVRALVAGGYVDHGYLDAHVHGYDDLVAAVEPYTPEETARICDVDVADVVRAVEVIGRAERLLSTVLQGFYQSHQATASSCAVNNIHLLRGMLGRPGCGVLQMNGQPTAQNAREAGSNGDLPGFRNWDNPAHIDQLAALWNVDRDVIPHDGPPTDALEIFRLAEAGDIGLLWIAATNPAVSLPQLPRIREILDREELFVVVQDGFLTETARYADVVLPAAMWASGRVCSPTSTGPCTTPARPSTRPVRPVRTWTSSSTTRAGWTSATATGSRFSAGTPPRVRSRRGRSAAAAGSATTPGSATNGSPARAASPGRSPRPPRTAATGSTPTASSPRAPTSARPTATTCRPAPGSPARSTSRSVSRAAPGCGGAPTPPQPRCPTTSTRSL